MKVRDGHVSNSSTSSFFVVAKKSDYMSAIKKAPKNAAIVGEALARDGKVANMEVVVVDITWGNGDHDDRMMDAYSDLAFANNWAADKNECNFEKSDIVASHWMKFLKVLKKQGTILLRSEHR